MSNEQDLAIAEERERVKKLKQQKVRLSFFLLGLASVIWAGCGSPKSVNTRLVEKGFYTYTLSDELLEEKGWRVYSSIDEENWQWDRHCHGGTSAPENPLITAYSSNEDTKFSIWISNSGTIWDHNHFTETVPISRPFIPNQMGEIYSGVEWTPIRFKDFMGNFVIVSGSLSTSEKLELIEELEYIGPVQETLVNPWSAEWCANN